MKQEIKQRIEQIKNGEVPHGYKRTKIGIVPNEWEEFYLCNLFNVIDGDRGENYPSKDEIFDNGYCIFLNTKNITKDGFNFNYIQYISEKKDKELRNGKLEKFDIVLTTRGTLGNAALNENIKYENLRINSGMVLLRGKDLKYIKYVYMYIKSNLFIHQVDKISFGSAQPQLTVKEIKKFKIVIPTNEVEQQKIVDILSIQDKVIELKEKLFKEKEKQKKYLMQNLLTRRKRLKGFNGEWKKVNLDEVLIEKKLKNENQNLLICSVSVKKGIINQVEYLGRSFSASDTSKYNLVSYGDIVYTKSPTGKFPYGIIKQSQLKEDVAVSPLYGVFEPINYEIGYILQVYFEYPINTNNYLNPIIQKGAKNTINISNNTFLFNKVYLPIEIEEQKAIAEILTTADRELKLLQEELEEEKRKKKALMQLLLTGIVRVKNW